MAIFAVRPPVTLLCKSLLLHIIDLVLLSGVLCPRMVAVAAAYATGLPSAAVLAHASLREDFMSMPTNRRCLVAFLVLALLMPYARAFVGLLFQVGVAAFLRSAR